MTDADSRTDTILERLCDLSKRKKKKKERKKRKKEKRRKKSRNLSKIVSVLLSASVERFDVSRMRDFFKEHSVLQWVICR